MELLGRRSGQASCFGESLKLVESMCIACNQGGQAGALIGSLGKFLCQNFLTQNEAAKNINPGGRCAPSPSALFYHNTSREDIS